jgi:tetratricopeptide (TPR) repeat protein
MTQVRNAQFFARMGLVALSLAIGSATALGASGGGGGGGGGGGSTPSCKHGTVYDTSKHQCVKNGASLDDKYLYQQGRDLALAARYDEALTALNAVKSPDSMTLTMIGYATRKLGNYDQGLAYYRKALALDPSNVNTHEYLGEAYAEKGKLDLAKAELIKVSAVCGTTCEQYQDLSKAIAGTPDQN